MVGGDDELSTGVAGLSELCTGSRSLEETLTRVAVLASETIPGADGVGLTLLERVGSDEMVASGEFVRVVGEVQYRLGEGPCLLAVETGAYQVCGSLGGEPRWPRFGPRAGRLGVHSALSLPLVVEEQVIGALNVYGRVRDAFDERSVRVGRAFSAPAAVTVANAHVLEDSRRLAARLQRAMGSRAVIDQAIGILMSRRGCDAQEAFDSLRGTSQASDTRLAEVARRVVEEAVARARALHAEKPPS